MSPAKVDGRRRVGLRAEVARGSSRPPECRSRAPGPPGHDVSRGRCLSAESREALSDFFKSRGAAFLESFSATACTLLGKKNARTFRGSRTAAHTPRCARARTPPWPRTMTEATIRASPIVSRLMRAEPTRNIPTLTSPWTDHLERGTRALRIFHGSNPRRVGGVGADKRAET